MSSTNLGSIQVFICASCVVGTCSGEFFPLMGGHLFSNIFMKYCQIVKNIGLLNYGHKTVFPIGNEITNFL